VVHAPTRVVQTCCLFALCRAWHRKQVWSLPAPGDWWVDVCSHPACGPAYTKRSGKGRSALPTLLLTPYQRGQRRPHLCCPRLSLALFASAMPPLCHVPGGASGVEHLPTSRRDGMEMRQVARRQMVPPAGGGRVRAVAETALRVGYGRQPCVQRGWACHKEAVGDVMRVSLRQGVCRCVTTPGHGLRRRRPPSGGRQTWPLTVSRACVSCRGGATGTLA